MSSANYLVDVSKVEHEGVRDTGFYGSAKWRKVRDSIKIRDKMTCRECGCPITGRYIVDHIEPVTVANVHDWDIAYNPDNLQLLCQRCHNAKTFNKQIRTKSFW